MSGLRLLLAAALPLLLASQLIGTKAGPPAEAPTLPPARPSSHALPSVPGHRPTFKTARRAARRFLADYLRQSSGQHRNNRKLPTAAAPLRRMLAHRPPQAAIERGGPWRLDRLEVLTARGELGIDLAATVRARGHRDTLVLAVRPDRNGRWLVAGLS